MKQLLFIFLFVASLADEFDTFKAEMETKVLTLATEMETIFGRRC